ncbi:MAG TPA: uroporphyrinogen decarboxylase family protein [Kiritimatiellia bacterium]|nr:uroporphyrinogen decarboxylase family protein [Kiritimatiellia bacterium]HPO37573.1 uroporphyrinogen decarboxylase family protein [Kiritimatiellia bacterium]HQA39102.1 uroporphyrinogen decarboxylase family protein [Kiritimatiellia bacterium]HQL50500.1 uroporphyrinogen decarboxylase family protein [Kiritimatiellia bacterium]HQQ92589.1 uroporphyrinogen decarboxylase family protein [Kiritimatiellia bacterium]
MRAFFKAQAEASFPKPFPVLSFPGIQVLGLTLPLLGTILGIGARACHFGDAVDLGEVLKGMPAGVPVMGNLSPSLYLRNGTPDRVAAATRAMVAQARGYANYIPSTGCDIPPLSPLENIDAFMSAAAEVGGGCAQGACDGLTSRRSRFMISHVED